MVAVATSAVAGITAVVVIASAVLASPQTQPAAVEYFPAPPPLADVAVPDTQEPSAAVAAAVPSQAPPEARSVQAYAWPAEEGDSLESIARVFGVTDLEQLRLVNRELVGGGPLEAGTIVYVPVDAAATVPSLPGADPAAARLQADPNEQWTVWDDLALCESSGDWHIDTGNGYYGGVQFKLSSWQWVGGTGYPHEHDRLTQIRMAERLLALQGWKAWPECSERLGLR